MDGTLIILDNIGDSAYRQGSREFLSNPILCDSMKIIMSNENQVENVIHIKNMTSFGGQSNRDISLANHVRTTAYDSLILYVPLDPPILLDGQTYFETDLEPLSEMDLIFYFEQEEITLN